MAKGHEGRIQKMGRLRRRHPSVPLRCMALLTSTCIALCSISAIDLLLDRIGDTPSALDRWPSLVMDPVFGVAIMLPGAVYLLWFSICAKRAASGWWATAVASTFCLLFILEAILGFVDQSSPSILSQRVVGAVLMTVLTVPTIWLSARVVSHSGRWGLEQGTCRHCGYDLFGNTSGKCPECGCATKPRKGGEHDEKEQ